MNPLVAQVSDSTPTRIQSRPKKVRALPEDLLREASRRLGIMSLLGAVLWIVGTGLDHLAVRASAQAPMTDFASPVTDGIAAASALISLALFFYTVRSQRDPRFILDLGLVYLVLTAMALGLIMHWDPVPRDWPVAPMISWIGAVILMFAAVVPTTRTKTLIAGLIAASMNPLAMLLARARGVWLFGAAGNALLMHYPDYVMVGVAVVIAHVHTNLSRQVARARELGSYQLGELLGRGGMGEVYEARHRMLARPAAIKLIRPEMIQSQKGEDAKIAIRRFRREAEAAASLRSPHTVELYDYGVTGDQTIYFVMELLDGMDLQSLVRQFGPVPAGRAIYILRQVCESLEEAHVRGLVHRDIKPANIHVGRLGLQHDFVKVLDFGLVKSMGDGGDEQALTTAEGLTPGTPAYMAPEMALGERVDGRADLYALGCVAYYLLTGALVFEAENAFQMLAKRLRDDPIPPSRRSPVDVPPALDDLVLACLAREPGNRPASAAALWKALGAIETLPWAEEQAKEWWNDHIPRSAQLAATPSPANDEATIVCVA